MNIKHQAGYDSGSFSLDELQTVSDKIATTTADDRLREFLIKIDSFLQANISLKSLMEVKDDFDELVTYNRFSIRVPKNADKVDAFLRSFMQPTIPVVNGVPVRKTPRNKSEEGNYRLAAYLLDKIVSLHAEVEDSRPRTSSRTISTDASLSDTASA